MNKSRRALHKLLAVAIVCVTGCVPYATSLRHVYFEERDDVVVYDRYRGGQDPPGLLFEKNDVPLKTRVQRQRYTIEILTPLTTGEPLAFLRVRAEDGTPLLLRGPNLLPLDRASGIYATEDFHYSFLIEDARGRPLQLEVVDTAGNVVGQERLNYRIRSRGVRYGVDSI